MGPLEFYDEFADEYSHVVIGGQSENPERINEEIVKVLKTEKVTAENFERNCCDMRSREEKSKKPYCREEDFCEDYFFHLAEIN